MPAEGRMASLYDGPVRGKFIDQFMWRFQHIFRPSVPA